MPLPALPAGRLLLIAGLVVLSLAACGRRGPLEAPLTSAELAAQQQKTQAQQARQQAQVDDDDDEEQAQSAVPVPVPTSRRRSRAYTIPKEPFILDPLL